MHTEAPKRLVILLWMAAVSGFLYYFSASMGAPMTFQNFINFTVLLWGGGLAYHVTSELIACPYSETTKPLWKSLFLPLSKVYVGYVIAAVSLYLAKKFGGDWGWLLALIGLLAGYFWVMHYILSLEKPIRQIIVASKQL